MAEPMKYALNEQVIATLGQAMRAVDPGSDLGPLSASVDRLDDLELKDRVNLLADALAEAMSGNLHAQLDTVTRMAQHADIDGFGGWPLASFVERHAQAEPEAALHAMAQITEHFTCEFAIRPFLTHHLDRTMKQVHRWTTAASEHPRRLASEGTRPKLPWGPDVPALLADPTIGLAVIQQLRHDPSEYVRRSVANHLNDIAKTHPHLVIEAARAWVEEPDTDQAMIRHALRTLIKQGNPDAMEILGLHASPELVVESFEVSPATVTLGESIELSAVLRSTATTPQRFVLDFVTHHVLANGSTSPKVFKWATPSIEAGETIELRKTRKIATASTRRYYPGYHRIDLHVAGRVAASDGFDLPVGS